MSGYRIVCGILWAVIAVGIGAGGVAEDLTIDQIGGAVICFVIAIPAGWYDYRIWALKNHQAPAHPLSRARPCDEHVSCVSSHLV